MPPDKVTYLATHYLSADLKPATSSKKRKRKTPAAPSGLLIQDDDEPGWSTSSHPDPSADPEAPVAIVAGTSAEFRRAKKSAWKTIQEKEQNTAAAAADAIIASAAAEQAAAAREADGEDVVDPGVGGGDGTDVAMMSNGTQAGLQSAKAITAQIKARQEEERKELEMMKRRKAEMEKVGGGRGEVGVLRDATGRRVDAAMRRAEMRRTEREREQKEEEKKRALKGEVQVEAARKKREELEEAKLMPLARGKDDEEMNIEMKAAPRWNDPMALFLTAEEERGEGWKGRKGRRPVYKGPAAPNRYGIRPGYRWDGVDRGNGFEAERFKAINRRERNKGLEYSWQMDE